MQAGLLRDRVELQQPVRAANSFGEAVITYQTRMQRWAALVPVSTSERTQGGQTVSAVNYRVTIRHDPQVGGEWRIRWGSKVLDIVSAVDPDGRGRTTEILATESTNP